jgi:glycosyltransferase involved in cell wall biosynthesis
MDRDFKLSVIVPVFNERLTLPKLIDHVRAVPIRKQIVLVDDASTDGTGEVIRAIEAGLLVDIPTRYRITPPTPLYFLAIAVPLDDFSAARPNAPMARLSIAALVAAVGAYNLYFLFAVARFDPHVLAELGDPRLAVAREIAAAQRLYKGEPVYVASECQVFDETNDYSWLYDLNGVQVIENREQLLDATGTVIADGDFIADVRDLPNAHDCRETRRQLGDRPLRWLRCRLGADPNSN